MKRVKIQTPGFEGLDLDRSVAVAFGTALGAVQKGFDELQDSLNSASITISLGNGQKATLNELGDRIATKGVVWKFWTTWREAAQKRGWGICDGRNGRPLMHPRPRPGGVDPGRFARATPYGTDPFGRIGGFEFHAHTVAVDNHKHNFSGTVDPCSGCCSGTCCVGTRFAEAAHKHNFFGTTLNAAPGGDTDSQAHLPPYCEFIYLVKL